MSPKEVKRENKKLIYEKPVLIGLGDTLNLGMGANCTNGSYASPPGGTCNTGHSAKYCGAFGYAATNSCSTGTWR